MSTFIIKEEHKVPTYRKNILDSTEFKSFYNEFNTSIQKLSLKLNTDIDMLEFLYDKIEKFDISGFRFFTAGDLKPIRDLCNEALVGINEFDFSINANFNDSQNAFITEYHLDKYLPYGFLSFDYFNFLMRYNILFN